ncbi:MAG: hypothetical protein VW268_15615, partial [Rhodospirillaceae bacterium]
YIVAIVEPQKALSYFSPKFIFLIPLKIFGNARLRCMIGVLMIETRGWRAGSPKVADIDLLRRESVQDSADSRDGGDVFPVLLPDRDDRADQGRRQRHDLKQAAAFVLDHRHFRNQRPVEPGANEGFLRLGAADFVYFESENLGAGAGG